MVDVSPDLEQGFQHPSKHILPWPLFEAAGSQERALAASYAEGVTASTSCAVAASRVN